MRKHIFGAMGEFEGRESLGPLGLMDCQLMGQDLGFVSSSCAAGRARAMGGVPGPYWTLGGEQDDEALVIPRLAEHALILHDVRLDEMAHRNVREIIPSLSAAEVSLIRFLLRSHVRPD